MIRYPARAARAIGYLKSHYNDIDVYVEDTSNHNMWLLILRKILPDKKITSVNLLGGRKAVIAACKLDQDNSSRSRIYIIDGDQDFLCGTAKPRLKHLCRIKAYCVENLLIRESPLIQIGLESKPTMDEVKLQSTLDFKRQIEGIHAALHSLFVVYGVASRLTPDLQTIGYSVTNLITQTGGKPQLDRSKVWARVLSLSKEIKARVGLSEFMEIRRQISTRISNLNYDQIISGKSYILPLVLLRFKAIFGYGNTNEAFKVALARFFDPLVEPALVRRLLSL